jgi:hypothetical protein
MTVHITKRTDTRDTLKSQSSGSKSEACPHLDSIPGAGYKGEARTWIQFQVCACLSPLLALDLIRQWGI